MKDQCSALSIKFSVQEIHRAVEDTNMLIDITLDKHSLLGLL